MEATYDGAEVTVVTEEVGGCYTFMETAPPKKKRKLKGHGENGKKTKKPRTAYLLYYYDIYLKLQQDFPSLRQSEINKKISESWKHLSVAEKGYYLERAKLEKEGKDPNANLTTASAMATDIPGFRRILPRSEYIIIPKATLHSNRTKSHGVLEPTPQSVSQENIQDTFCSTNTTAVESGHFGISEHCVGIEGLAQETTTFSQPGSIHEVITSEILSQCTSSAGEKVNDLILSETSLELADTHPYQTSGIVIEETLVTNSGDFPQGGIALAQQQQTSEGVSLVAVVADEETEETSVSAPATQFIMVPLPPAQQPKELAPFVKLTTTYTRRGRGSCTNPGCSFSYVTRHKPLQCAKCGKYLGGKWIPKVKESQSVRVAAEVSTVPQKVAPEEGSPVASDSQTVRTENVKYTTENSEAVTQLLNVTSDDDHDDLKTEWEEVVISDTHSLYTLQKLEGGGPDSEKQDGGRQNETVSAGEHESKSLSVKQVLPNGLYAKTVSQTPFTTAENVAASAFSAGVKTLEPKGKAKVKPSLLAAGRPVRAILPAPVCSDKRSHPKTPGLKPSTLKQLGHSVQSVVNVCEQKVNHSIFKQSPQLQIFESRKETFPSYKCSTWTNTFDLGLATSRGRGKCKNPLCSYVYTNRHKPQVCPRCGYILSKDKPQRTEKLSETLVPLLAPGQSLTQSQKEIQRQSTLLLLRKTVQIPENESDLTEVLTLIQELNMSWLILSSSSGETVTFEHSSWPSYYESASTHCGLCDTPLYKVNESSQESSEECWLLTATHLQMVSAQAKCCLNPRCLALHMFTDINSGLFNVGNRLLVSLDLLLRIRTQIKAGEDPREAFCAVMNSVVKQTGTTVQDTHFNHLLELLCNGYWAFECLTIRDYNDMICGICGVAPKVEIAQRNKHSVLSLQNIEFTWPDFLTSAEVNVDDFWLTMEMEAIEQAAFPASIPITKFDASIIAPFIPPLMRAGAVVNTEKDKNSSKQFASGNVNVLVRLCQEGAVKLDKLSCYSEDDLKDLLQQCNVPYNPSDSKDQMCNSLLSLYHSVENGYAELETEPDSLLTGGKIYKVCPHQVICGSKYIVKPEFARDHVDLLVSSRHWPPIYAVDLAAQVALTTDVCYPELAAQMWGKNQGCFSDPMEPVKYVSCPELLDSQYSIDISTVDNSVQHPVTKSAVRRILCSKVDTTTEICPDAQHRSFNVCKELEPYDAIISSVADSKTNKIRQKAVTFENATYYYLYNRLIDFLTSKDIVTKQINEVVQSCQPGEVVIRDALYRLGVAQINTEAEVQYEEDGTLL
ncbi:HMG domain-containing protein 3 [Protopterus annectens]|uniref:HMG domain-containing protein 3 n=1 Tax=Protopterus annectens TaxID=7888 RepID=UPI001CFA9023|nr:HMG domain-containing protein 3 [Protopterus annectens]XP_043925538.1 HMG domain-containing protein 3 [Protopterus annectens]